METLLNCQPISFPSPQAPLERAGQPGGKAATSTFGDGTSLQPAGERAGSAPLVCPVPSGQLDTGTPSGHMFWVKAEFRAKVLARKAGMRDV